MYINNNTLPYKALSSELTQKHKKINELLKTLKKKKKNAPDRVTVSQAKLYKSIKNETERVENTLGRNLGKECSINAKIYESGINIIESSFASRRKPTLLRDNTGGLVEYSRLARYNGNMEDPIIKSKLSATSYSKFKTSLKAFPSYYNALDGIEADINLLKTILKEIDG